METKTKRVGRWTRVLLAIAIVLATGWTISISVPSYASADATTDAVNSTVTLVTSLLFSLIPLIVIMSIFSLIMGMFVGSNGIFSRFR